jgi:hypothetical protein
MSRRHFLTDRRYQSLTSPADSAQTPLARVVELVDTTVFKTEVLAGHAGSSPVASTIETKGNPMSMAGKKMKRLDEEIARIDAEILRMQSERAGLLRAKSLLSTDEEPTIPRKRSPNIKPLILEIMEKASTSGETSTEVDRKVRARVPSVADATVGSVLSRLKADKALVFDGERYYDARFAPKSGGSPVFN